MSITICLGASTLPLLEAGGHMWFYLNWALGLKALGCQVVWLEEVPANVSGLELRAQITGLQDRLAPFGLADCTALTTPSGASLPPEVSDACLSLEAALDAALLLDLGNKIAAQTVARFRRSALVDIDPGLMQIWLSESKSPLPRHDVYFSIGETVGTLAARFPDCGVTWHYTPTAIYL